MDDHFDPFQILASKQKELGETWAEYRQRRDGEITGEKIDLDDARARYEAALEEFQQTRLNYFPFSAARTISSPPIARAVYSDRMAWLMANMANLAYIRYDYGYEPDEQARSQRQANGIEQLNFCLQSGRYDQTKDKDKPAIDPCLTFDLVRIFDTSETGSTDTQAFLAKTTNFAVLAFRGTEPDQIRDILIDLKAVLHSTRNGEVHLGFMDAYLEVKAEIHAVLPEIGNLPLYITGHSMGAGLATIAAQDLDQDKRFRDQLAACYTFASPRVGDGKYEGKIKIPFYRMAYFADIVTLLPFFFWIYVHTGDPRYLSPATKGRMIYRGMPVGVRTWEILTSMLKSLISGQNPLSIWVDSHAIQKYIEHLKMIALANNAV